MNLDKYKLWFEIFSNKILEHQNYLSELDTPIGDGDHGGNMVRGVKAIQEVLEDENIDDLKSLYSHVAMALIKNVGGASGPLYGSAFLAMSKNSEQPICKQLRAGFEALKVRGKSELGEKTMLDVWGPAIDLIERGLLTTDDLSNFVNKTKSMKATKGRASYLGDRSVGHVDPGAMSSKLLFESLLESGVLDE